MSPLKNSPILRNGPFSPKSGLNRLNLRLLALLLPALITAWWPRAQQPGLVWTWPLTLFGSFLGILLFAPHRRRALADLDWAVAAALAGLMLHFPDQRELELAASFFCGLLAGMMSVRGPGRKLLWLPGLIPVIALLGALAGASLIHHFLLTDSRGLFFVWGSGGWAQVCALMAAGVCLTGGRGQGLYLAIPWLAGGRGQGLYLAIPWLAGTLGWLFLSSRSPLPVHSPAPEALSYTAALLLPLFFILPQLLHRLLLKHPAAAGQPEYEPSPLRAYLKCGHQGRAPRLAEWTGLPSCRLAAAHDGGPLDCPYGCLALGDCLRACSYGAISLNEDGFPKIDRVRCQGCGRCRDICPKSLFQLARARVFIPCRAASPLKKNAAYCQSACLGCGRCRKACPAGAIGRPGTFGAMNIDQDTCQTYGPNCGRICVKACPRHIIIQAETVLGK